MNSDMSAKAVVIRLKRTAQLRSLCLSLAKARPAAKAVEQKPPDRPNERTTR